MSWKSIRRREYNSARYKRNRRILLARNPNCAECYRQGRIVAATECDHIVSIRTWYARGLPARECSGIGNMQVLCEDCHRKKTDVERNVVVKARRPVFDRRGRRVV